MKSINILSKQIQWNKYCNFWKKLTPTSDLSMGYSVAKNFEGTQGQYDTHAILADGKVGIRYLMPSVPDTNLTIESVGHRVPDRHRLPSVTEYPGHTLTPPWVHLRTSHVTRLSFQVPAAFLAAQIRIVFPDTSVEMAFAKMVDFHNNNNNNINNNNNNKKKNNKSQSPWTTRTIITNRWRHPWPKQSTCTTLNWPSTFPQFVLNNLG